MKLKQTLLFCVLSVLLLQGCGMQAPAAPDSVSDWFYNRSENMLVHKVGSPAGSSIRILDYGTMQDVTLCSKPNCTHKTADCILHRLGDNVPVFGDGKAYFFIDDPILVRENDDGRRVYQMGTTLYAFDMKTNMEEKLCHIDGGVTGSNTGWLLHDGRIYFVLNEYAKNYDENGNATGVYSNVGGVMRLCAVDLSDMQVTDSGPLYDILTLTKYFPDAPYSAECCLYGVFDDKIWFTVSCREAFDEKTSDIRFVNYVTYFDLKTQTYCGEPADFSNFGRGRIRWLSADYLAVAGEHQVMVSKAGQSEPIPVQDDAFNVFSTLSVFDDKLFCEGKVFDLHTLAVTEPDALDGKTVLAKYGDSYIVSNENDPEQYEKIPAETLLDGGLS